MTSRRRAATASWSALNQLIAEHGQSSTYLRPLSEMNNGNNPYSAYDLMGRPRGPALLDQRSS